MSSTNLNGSDKDNNQPRNDADKDTNPSLNKQETIRLHLDTVVTLKVLNSTLDKALDKALQKRFDKQMENISKPFADQI